MSQKLVSFELTTQEVYYYSVFKLYGEKSYDNPEHWPVEEYDDAQKTIIFEQVVATIDDVLEFAKILQGWIIDASERLKQDGTKISNKELLQKDNIEFVIEGTAEYTFAGENCRFRIEVKGESITIQESDNYIFFGSMYFSDYEEFCATKTILCDNLGNLCSEENFDPDCEYCITHDKIYADEFPPYGKKTPANKHMKAGVVYSFNDAEAKELFNGESFEDVDEIKQTSNENIGVSSQHPLQSLIFGFSEGLKVEGVGYSISIPDGFQFQQNMDVTDSMATTTRDFVAWSPKELEPDLWSEADVAILSAVQVSAETILLNPVEWFDKIKESLSLLGKTTGSEVYSKSFVNDNVCGGYAVQRISDDCVNYHCVVGENQNAHQFRIIINKPYSQQSMDNAVESWLKTMKCKSADDVKKELKQFESAAKRKKADEALKQTDKFINECKTLLQDLNRKWQNSLNDLQNQMSRKVYMSNNEVIRDMQNIVKNRDRFGRNYDELISQIDENGDKLLAMGADYRAVKKIVKLIDDVMKASDELDLDFGTTGATTMNIGSAKFSFSFKSVNIKKKWSQKYQQMPEVLAAEKKQRLTREVNSSEKRIQTLEAELSEFMRSEQEIQSELDLLQKQITSAENTLDADKDDIIEKASAQMRSQKQALDSIIKKKTEAEHDLSEVNSEINGLSFFKRSLKKELTAKAENLRAKVQSLSSQIKTEEDKLDKIKQSRDLALKELDKKLSDMRDDLLSKKKRLFELSESIKKNELEIDKEKETLDRKKAELQSLETEL